MPMLKAASPGKFHIALRAACKKICDVRCQYPNGTKWVVTPELIVKAFEKSSLSILDFFDAHCTELISTERCLPCLLMYDQGSMG